MLENDTSAAAVGKRLRYVRKLTDLSREELAKLADVSQTSISYWEHADDESSKMTLRSMAKVLNALRERGVECTERWLRSGTGASPRYIGDSNHAQPANDRITIDKTALSAQLIANISEEIKRFTSISDLAVIIKMDTNCMYPALKQGDIAGGIWQFSPALEVENICIIELGGKLQIRRVIPTSKSGLFHIAFLSYDTNQTEPFELKDIVLEKIAPVIRVWR